MGCDNLSPLTLLPYRTYYWLSGSHEMVCCVTCYRRNWKAIHHWEIWSKYTRVYDLILPSSSLRVCLPLTDPHFPLLLLLRLIKWRRTSGSVTEMCLSLLRITSCCTLAICLFMCEWLPIACLTAHQTASPSFVELTYCTPVGGGEMKLWWSFLMIRESADVGFIHFWHLYISPSLHWKLL